MPLTLAEKSCTPCRGGIPPLTEEEAAAYRVQAPDWELLDQAKRIERTYGFKNLAGLSNLSSARARSRAEGHHPDISFGWGYATVSLRTKENRTARERFHHGSKA
jgi:4a-hydroxytetrahydrobiopterin dehydratase